MTTMQTKDWEAIEFFKPEEFSQPDKMEYHFINRLDMFRKMIDKPIIIHSSYREGDPRYHGKGEAVDIHIKGISLLCAYALANESGLFGGIGVYPKWNNPGLHLDMRPERARWGCWTPTDPKKKNIYVPLDSAFLERIDNNVQR